MPYFQVSTLTVTPNDKHMDISQFDNNTEAMDYYVSLIYDLTEEDFTHEDEVPKAVTALTNDGITKVMFKVTDTIYQWN